MEELAKYTIFEVGELPPCKHASGMHGEACLSFKRRPIRRNSRNYDLVAWLEIADQFANFLNNAYRFVAKDHIAAITNRPFPNGMHVYQQGIGMFDRAHAH